MRAHCSWCRAEGTPAYLGEREPLENEGDTYGVCSRHMLQVLTAPRPRHSGSVQLLIVVALRDRSLYDYLSRGLATVDGARERVLSSLANWLETWQQDGFAPVRTAWLARAHAIGSALTVWCGNAGRGEAKFKPKIV